MCVFFPQREQPIYSAKAHVFQIDPATKRNWLPASKHAVTVSFFYDAGRSVYRIISVGGTKVGVAPVRMAWGIVPVPGSEVRFFFNQRLKVEEGGIFFPFSCTLRQAVGGGLLR